MPSSAGQTWRSTREHLRGGLRGKPPFDCKQRPGPNDHDDPHRRQHDVDRSPADTGANEASRQHEAPDGEDRTPIRAVDVPLRLDARAWVLAVPVRVRRGEVCHGNEDTAAPGSLQGRRGRSRTSALTHVVLRHQHVGLSAPSARTRHAEIVAATRVIRNDRHVRVSLRGMVSPEALCVESAMPEPPVDEATLLERSRFSPAAFGPIYERYFPRVYGYCFRRLGNPQDAEDAAALVFTRALGSLQGYRGGSVPAWLFRIAHNAVANILRTRRPNLRPVDDSGLVSLASREEGPPEQVVHAEERRHIEALLATLTDDQREIVTLRLDGGLTAREVGAIVGKTEGAVRVAFHRALQHLRQAEQAGGGAP